MTALRANPTHPAVAEALHVAEFALTSLPAGVVATTMTRLLETAWDCHRSGVVGESRLVCRHSAAARALRLAG
ncbi:hypothetical protein [Pseudonocardia sp.]|uniref:hypothetical protein n=1 Tax=Pseudonocardia sp. TaxID=60912 RepID=UPI003D0C36A4